MIQAFPSYRSDDSLDVSALRWRPRSAENFFDTQHLDLFLKLVSVNPISIPKQVFWCAVEWKGFDDLLGGPRGRWVSRDVKVENTTAVVSKHNKNEQNFKPDRMHREKIDRTELRDVVLEECSPGMGWRLVMPDHVFRHRCLCNLDTQCQEFTANPRHRWRNTWSVITSLHPRPGEHSSKTTSLNSVRSIFSRCIRSGLKFCSFLSCLLTTAVVFSTLTSRLTQRQRGPPSRSSKPFHSHQNTCFGIEIGFT